MISFEHTLQLDGQFAQNPPRAIYPAEHALHNLEFVQDAHLLLLLQAVQFELESRYLPVGQVLGHYPPTKVMPALQV